MKNLIFLFLVLVGLNVYSQETSNVEKLKEKIENFDVQKVQDSVNETIEKVNNIVPDSINIEYNGKYYEDIKEFLYSMSKSLQIGINEVFDVIVKQQIVKSTAILLGLLSLLFLINTRVRSFNKWRKQNPDSDLGDNSGGIGNVIAGAILTIIFITFSMKYTLMMLTGFINPKFGAYQDIITFISEMK